MIDSIVFYKNSLLTAEAHLQSYDWEACGKAYIRLKTSLICGDIFTKESFQAGASFIMRIVCVLVGYTPLVGRISQWAREVFWELNPGKREIEPVVVAAPTQITVDIFCLDGTTFEVQVLEIGVVGQLKQVIANQRGIHFSAIDLFLAGRQDPLCASCSLASHGVIQASKIFMLLGPDNKAALEAVYDSCGGSSWTINTGWKTELDISQWFGVTVNEDGKVVQLELSNNNLQGNIPNQIGSLTQLTYLNLSRNDLLGRIPANEIGKLTVLEVFILRFNHLTGQIPQEIQNLTSLRKLSLEHNNLSGQIPTTICKLTQLNFLNLRSNSLSGQIPTTICDLTRITQLNLASNNLTGEIPKGIEELPYLASLVLDHNQLSGVLPEALKIYGNSILAGNQELIG